MTTEMYNFVLIEDDPGEQKILKMLIKNSGFSSLVKTIDNGEEAVEFFNSFPEASEIFRHIHLIILDLNIPRINGIEVLRHIKANLSLRKTPVIILTTSNNESDIALAYECGASGYIRKPSTIEEYETSMQAVFNYWFRTCILPAKGSA